MALEVLVGTLGFALALVTALVGWIVALLRYQAEKARKELAAERDMAHLKRHYESLALSYSELHDEIEERFNRLEISLSRCGVDIDEKKNRD